MQTGNESSQTQARLLELNKALESGTYNQMRSMLNGLNAPASAHLLESSPPKVRNILWNLFDAEHQSHVLQHLNEDVLTDLLVTKNTEALLSVLENIDSDDLTDILQQLPDTVTQQVINAMDAQNRARVENLLSYPEDTAAGLMNTDTISVRPRFTLDVVFRYLRRHTELPDMTDNIFVVNRLDEYVGLLPITKLLVSDPSMTVREIMSTEIDPIPADLSDQEVANLFERYDLVSAPVIDASGKLLGRITIDDVVDVIRESADHSLLGMAGLDEDDDTFAPIFKTARRRAFWLGANLITAFIASAVINIFEETIVKVVALAVLMPIVASMGGVAGSQTLTLVIRSMALGQIGEANSSWFFNRELAVGALNGLFWAAVVAIVTSMVFQDLTLGFIIAMAMVINLITAAVAGVSLPMILKSYGIDPAIAGTVVLTTITDVVGFMSFLGLATIYYS
ncbi:MAG: magnesium transporter [Gammaproteobacteria bacterium]|nr:magnesium transporter [Gammaproteobacteria bacterium]